MLQQLISEWHRRFDHLSVETIIRSPGRVNIIGEHTDYNEGWVMPGAMNLYVFILACRSTSNASRWIAMDLNEEWNPDEENLQEMPLWAKYIQGAVSQTDYKNEHFNFLIGGNLPIGAGVSSSSSLVCGILFCIQQLNGGSESREELARRARNVERNIIGLQGGIMDQFSILLSKQDHVMILDCRTHQYDFISSAMKGYNWMLVNSRVKHQLINTDYNTRAKDCADAVKLIKGYFPHVQSLRDVTMDMLISSQLPEILHRRSAFVLEENGRVHEMKVALSDKDPVSAGNLLKLSHAGLRDMYEVSCAELDFLADFANNYVGIMGARMMGGGFGGCIICLLKNEVLSGFTDEISKSYFDAFGIQPDIINYQLGDGVSVVFNE